jgi:two-component system CheB/CheR fusion protein
MMRRLREKTTALEDSLERMREVDAMKTRFINIASHELRTPMTPIRTELHIIQTGRRGPLTPEQQKGLQMVARNVDRLNRLIRELLEASRMQAGALKLTNARVDLAELVAGVVAMMENEARGRGIALRAEVPALFAHADEDRVLQVFINLLENALQFTPAGGSVTLLGRAEGAHAVLEVRDTGAGIDPKLIPRLFQPFSQAEPGVPRTEGGTGLGLYICKGIVEAHEGRIWCESQGKGCGTSFFFTLPLHVAPEPATPAVDPFGRAAPLPAGEGAAPPRHVF